MASRQMVRGNKLLHYSLATIGPIGAAGAQFALSLVLLHRLSPASFGSFSFLLVSAQLSWGAWSALFCAPLPALMSTGDSLSQISLLRCLQAANLLGAVVAFLVFGSVGLALGSTALGGLLFAGYAAVMLLRWFARAQAYATGAPLRSTNSDIVYSLSLLLGVLLLILVPIISLELTFGTLLVSAMLGLLPFGRSYLSSQFVHIDFRELRRYRPVWINHSRWALLGVMTTEATANAHVYIVTLIYGPSGYAPLAASGLLIRPVQVAMNALSEFERAQIARKLGETRLDLAMEAVRYFRLFLLAMWLATALATVAVFIYSPHLVFPKSYELKVLLICGTLWMIVAAVRAIRTPESVLLQAAGAFQPLAYASVVSAIISIFAVMLLLYFSGPLWSIAGILIGEIIFATWTLRQAGRWRRQIECSWS